LSFCWVVVLELRDDAERHDEVDDADDGFIVDVPAAKLDPTLAAHRGRGERGKAAQCELIIIYASLWDSASVSSWLRRFSLEGALERGIG
jgi:hypothetical protein